MTSVLVANVNHDIRNVQVCVATVLPPVGDTGVQTHIRTFAAIAQERGFHHVSIATPYSASKLLRGPLRRLTRLIGYCHQETGILWSRKYLTALLFRQIADCVSAYDGRTVIYAQDPLSAKAALSLKSKGAPVEVVLAVHFNVSQGKEAIARGWTTETGALYKFLVNVEQDVVPRVDRLIFVSKFMAQSLLARFPQLENVPYWIVPNATSDPGVVPDTCVDRDLVTIGSLEPRKNHQFLIRVLAATRRLGYEYSMTIVGDGESKEALAELVEALGLQDLVTFAGYCADAKNLIGLHRAYVHSALMENLPLVLIEALAYARPVFAAPVGGISEIFTDGIEGCYWNLDDPVSAAKKIIKVLENRDVYQRMSQAARERYNATFKSDVLGPILLDAVMGVRNATARGDGPTVMSGCSDRVPCRP